MLITIDLETCPAQNPSVRADIAASIKPPATHKKQETIDAWMKDNAEAETEAAWRKTAFDGALGHICVIGVAFDDSQPIALYYDDWLVNEARLLLDFSTLVDAACHGARSRPTFIGHNLVDFDLRFLFQRSVVLNVKPSHYIPFTAKPWDESVYDTMQKWSAKDRSGMTKICKALGIDGKGDVDGSKVWDYVKDGKIADVAEYCKGDIERTRAMYKRFNFIAAAA